MSTKKTIFEPVLPPAGGAGPASLLIPRLSASCKKDTIMLDLSNPALGLSFLPSLYTIIRFPPSFIVPSEILHLFSHPSHGNQLISLTRTSEETSLILSLSHTSLLLSSLPLDFPTHDKQEEGPWKVIRVQGPMELNMKGVMAALTKVLAEEGVAVFVNSTWDTDYVLVHEGDGERAGNALQREGWKFA